MSLQLGEFIKFIKFCEILLLLTIFLKYFDNAEFAMHEETPIFTFFSVLGVLIFHFFKNVCGMKIELAPGIPFDKLN